MSEVRAGAGGLVLRLFVNPLSARVLRAHADGPIRPSELYRELIWAPRTTVRNCVAGLREAGALAKRRIGGSPHAVENELTPAGEEMLLVAEAVEAWLARAPQGPLSLDGDGAKAAIKALVGGWSSPVMEVLATGPSSLLELDRAAPGASYPLLKRRLAEMQRSRQIEPIAAGGSDAPRRFAVTEWLRRAIAPLSIAARYEGRHMAKTTSPIGAAEVETALLLAVPLVSLPAGATGACALGVEDRDREPASREADLPGITVGFAAGEAVTCRARASGSCASWARGTAGTWLDLLAGERPGTALRFSKGESHPAVDLTDALELLTAQSTPPFDD